MSKKQPKQITLADLSAVVGGVLSVEGVAEGSNEWETSPTAFGGKMTKTAKGLAPKST
jgi:hypothetical protein